MQNLDRFREASFAPPEVRQQAATGFLQAVFGWMTVGLALTGVVAWFTAHNPALQQVVLGNRLVFFGLILAEFAMVIGVSAAINRLSYAAAGSLFLLYSGLNGLTLSAIFLIYTMNSVAGVFFISAGTFGAVALYGATTKRDLSSLGALSFMGLIGIILASVVNMFVGSSSFMLLISYIGVAVFVGLTAYDMQRLKAMHMSGAMQGETGAKLAVLGALSLYLDFINLFLMLLRILGNRR
jgi:hypothetical protein